MKKIYKIGIVAVILVSAVGAFWLFQKSTLKIIATEDLTQPEETTVVTESHTLTVKLNLASYEIEYSDTFDISVVDVAINADGYTSILF